MSDTLQGGNDTITITGVPPVEVINGPANVYANATINDTAGIEAGGALFDLATFTVSGGTLSEPTGLGAFMQTGPGTYALGENSPGSVTQELRTLVFTPTAAVGNISLHVQDNHRTTPNQPISTADANTVFVNIPDLLPDLKAGTFGQDVGTAIRDLSGSAKVDFAQSMSQMLSVLHHT